MLAAIGVTDDGHHSMTRQRSLVNWLDSRPAIMLCLLFLLTVVVRLGYLSIAPGLMLGPDYVKEYSPLASNILAGNGFAIQVGQPYNARVPLYPLFLAGLYGIFGVNDNVVRIALALIDGASAISVYLIALRIFHKRVAILSAVAFALYPPLIHLSSYAMSDNLFILLNLAFTLFLVKFFLSPSLRYALICGGLLGLTGLVKPVPVLLPVLLLIAFPLYARYALHGLNMKQAARLGVLLLAFFLTILPWSIRDYAVFHEVTVLTVSRSTLGDMVLLSSLQGELLPVHGAERHSLYVEKKQETIQQETGNQVGGAQQGQALTRYVFRRVLSDPLGYVVLSAKKFAYFWYATDSGRYEKVLMFLQGAVLFWAVLGFILFLRKDNWQKILPILLLLVYYPAFHTVSYAIARYSMTIMPLVMMFSIYGVVHLYRMGKEHLQKPSNRATVPIN